MLACTVERWTSVFLFESWEGGKHWKDNKKFVNPLKQMQIEIFEDNKIHYFIVNNDVLHLHLSSSSIFLRLLSKEELASMCGRIYAPCQTNLWQLIFSLNFFYLCRYFPVVGSSKSTVQLHVPGDWVTSPLRGFYFVKPGRWTVVLIYSDIAMLVGSAIHSGKANREEEGRWIILLTLPSLFKKGKRNPLLQASLVTIAANLSFWIYVITHVHYISLLLRFMW